jgi:hypothetical protein
MHPATMSLGEASGILEALVEKLRGGVRVRAIVNGAPPDPRLGEVLRERAQVRTLPEGVSGGMMVVDRRELILSFVSDPSGRLSATEDVSLWTDARDLVELQARLFDSLWNDATPLLRPIADRP